MRLYFDSAYIAKCYLNEPDASKVRRRARSASGLYSSAWSVAEVSSVILRQLREGTLSPRQSDVVRDQFLDDIRKGVWNLLPVSELLLYRLEGGLRLLPPDVYLRAGDAVHLTTAQNAGFSEIWTNDRHMLAAAPHFQLAGRFV